jgi:CelD/BcsL family acetyltransferase involved in cellulose biosynthesis
MIAAQRDGYVIVPTFSHDSRFDRYTPGVLLLNAFFQTFCGSDLRVMDLSRGNEKYKYRYLCLPEEYHADHFKIRRS